VEPKDYTGLSAPKVDVDVTDEAVEARLEEMRRDQSMFVPVEGRDVVELGDYAVASTRVSSTGPLYGEPSGQRAARGHPRSLLENKAEHLVGARVGETRDLAVGFPQDYTWPTCAGRKGASRSR